MIRFRNTRVTVTHPSEDSQHLVINTRDALSATIGAIPSAIDAVTIPWERPSARDDSSAGQASMLLILDTEQHDLLRWDAHVTITTEPAAGDGTGYWQYGDPIVVWDGWIDQVTVQPRRVRHPDTQGWVTTWAHTVTMYDLIGRASGTKIGDTPWPEEGPTERLDRIAARAPYPLLSADALPGNWESNNLAPRDVDNVPLIDPVQSVAASMLLTVHPAADGLQLHALPGNELAFLWNGASDPTRLPTVPLRAGTLTQAGRNIDRSGRVTRVVIGYTFQDQNNQDTDIGDPEERTRIVDDPTATATAEVRIDTENLVRPTDGTDSLSAHVAWATSMLEFTREPVSVLDPVEVLLDLFDYDDLPAISDLVTMGGRSSALVRISDAPTAIYPYQHVVGGTLELHGARDRLTLTLAPTPMGGQRALVWADMESSNPGGEPLTWGSTQSGWVHWGDLTVSTLPPKG